jgi:predicted amidohydrolase YtcJ
MGARGRMSAPTLCVLFTALSTVAGAREDPILILGNPAGSQTVAEKPGTTRAGIPPAEVLRLATLTSAQVIGADGERGVIAPGRLADLILVDGDPSTQIADINEATLVVKGGHIYDPARIEQALGIAPRDRT